MLTNLEPYMYVAPSVDSIFVRVDRVAFGANNILRKSFPCEPRCCVDAYGIPSATWDHNEMLHPCVHKETSEIQGDSLLQH